LTPTKDISDKQLSFEKPAKQRWPLLKAGQGQFVRLGKLLASLKDFGSKQLRTYQFNINLKAKFQNETVTEPRMTEPRKTESRKTECRKTEPRKTEPRMTEPRIGPNLE
jgi:hypothetical protein